MITPAVYTEELTGPGFLVSALFGVRCRPAFIRPVDPQPERDSNLDLPKERTPSGR